MVIILRGPSGVGKSSLVELLMSNNFKYGQSEPAMRPQIAYIKSIWGSFHDKEHTISKFSADDYYMVDGEYKFDPAHLGTAHNGCLREFARKLLTAYADTTVQHILIVDNTNCTVAETVPYAALASAYAHELHILTLFPADVNACYARNKHRVPLNNVIKQDLALRTSIAEMPPWFPQQLFIVE